MKSDKPGRLTRAFYQAPLKGYIRQVREGIFAGVDKSVVYSGKANKDRAEAVAEKLGLRPVEFTKGGDALNQAKLFDRLKTRSGDIRRAANVWDEASRKYCRDMKGNALTYVTGARKESTFRRVELPTMLKNTKLDSINGVKRARLHEFQQRKQAALVEKGATRRQAVRLSHNEAYRAVALSEIRRDLKQARARQDATLRKDAGERWATFRKQWKTEQKAKDFIPRREVLRQAVARKTEASPRDWSQPPVAAPQTEYRKDWGALVPFSGSNPPETRKDWSESLISHTASPGTGKDWGAAPDMASSAESRQSSFTQAFNKASTRTQSRS